MSYLNLPFYLKTIYPSPITTDPAKDSVPFCLTVPFMTLKCYSQVSSEPYLLQAEQTQLSQPFLSWEVVPSLGSFLWPCSGHSPRGPYLSCTEDSTSTLDAVLQVSSHQHRTEGQDPLPHCSGHASIGAAQDMVGFVNCEDTLVDNVHLAIHQYTQAFFWYGFTLSFCALAYRRGCHDLALGFVELHEVHLRPLLKAVQVPLDGILFLGVLIVLHSLFPSTRFFEGSLSPTVDKIDEDIKEHWSLNKPLRDFSSLTSIQALSHKASGQTLLGN